jgi:glycosyltransferase involved in cell wall biosynthesis
MKDIMATTDFGEPRVSVLCMTYNHADKIGQCLEAIVTQKTDFPFEVIVHDDASSDGTADIVREFEQKYPDIVFPVCQTKNQYHLCNIAHTHLLPRVRGKYVAICEGDDFWTDENKLQTQYDIMESNPSYSLCFHSVTQQNADGSAVTVRPLKQSGVVPAETVIARGGMFCPSVSLFFRRDVMESWPQFRLDADVYDYPTQVLAATMGEIYYLDRNMGTYRFAAKDSWTAQHLGDTDNAHVENETKWLEEFNSFTDGKYNSAVSYHMAHLWFTEYRKTLSPASEKKAKGYIKTLDFKNRLVFGCLLLMYSVLGKKADGIFERVKRQLLK